MLGERKHSLVLKLGLSVLVSLCLWTKNFTNVSQFIVVVVIAVVLFFCLVGF